jgi:hypothetical protein
MGSGCAPTCGGCRGLPVALRCGLRQIGGCLPGGCATPRPAIVGPRPWRRARAAGRQGGRQQRLHAEHGVVLCWQFQRLVLGQTSADLSEKWSLVTYGTWHGAVETVQLGDAPGRYADAARRMGEACWDHGLVPISRARRSGPLTASRPALIFLPSFPVPIPATPGVRGDIGSNPTPPLLAPHCFHSDVHPYLQACHV